MMRDLDDPEANWIPGQERNDMFISTGAHGFLVMKGMTCFLTPDSR